MILIVAEDTDGAPPTQTYCDALAKSLGVKDVLLLRDDATQKVINQLKLNPVNHWHFVLSPGMKIAYAKKGGPDQNALNVVQGLIDAL